MQNQACVVLIALFLTSSIAHAEKQDYNNTATGKPGNVEDISRTISIEAYEYRFAPSEITVKQGETIRFIVSNTGEKRHEMMIDTLAHLKEHAKMMRSHPEMQHNDSNQITLYPGEQKELIWQFTQTGIIDFACPIPGHFKGMRGKIFVEEI
ncbi:MAG: cupredoxin family protein [Nitrosomonas sp.]|nr:cupredoxin family protein [Nitrosomonas sp.]